MDELLMLELDCAGGSAEAFVNGMPVARVAPRDSLLIQLPVHEYVTSGHNEIRLVVEPGETPLDGQTIRQHTFPPGYYARIRVMRMPRGSFPHSPGVVTLLDLRFQPEPGTEPVPVPLVRTADLPLDIWAARWSWMDARELPDTEALRRFALSYVSNLVAALQSGDPEPYLVAARPRFEELSAAYGVSVENEYASFREQFQRLSGEPGFRMHTVTAADAAFRLCAGGRVVDCLDRNWRPLLRSEPRESDGVIRYRLPLRFCFLNDQPWVIR